MVVLLTDLASQEIYVRPVGRFTSKTLTASKAPHHRVLREITSRPQQSDPTFPAHQMACSCHCLMLFPCSIVTRIIDLILFQKLQMSYRKSLIIHYYTSDVRFCSGTSVSIIYSMHVKRLYSDQPRLTVLLFDA